MEVNISKMKQYLSVLMVIIVSTVIAYPQAEPAEIVVDPNIAVYNAILRQVSSFLELIYDTAEESIQNGTLELIGKSIVASLPKSLRQDVANELEYGSFDGTLSEGLMKRIRRQILEWSLQYIPNELRGDISKALEESNATGQITNNNEQLVKRVRQYVASLNTKGRRVKREFWSDLIVTILNVLVDILIEVMEDSIDYD